MLKEKVPIQFEYIIHTASTKCPFCDKRLILKSNRFGQIKDYNCKCGATFKVPHHYAATYHNKQVKVEKSETRWI